jgi:hypothetical protein
VRKKMIAAFPPAAPESTINCLLLLLLLERVCGMAKGNSRYLRYMAPYTQHKI